MLCHIYNIKFQFFIIDTEKKNKIHIELFLIYLLNLLSVTISFGPNDNSESLSAEQ